MDNKTGKRSATEEEFDKMMKVMEQSGEWKMVVSKRKKSHESEKKSGNDASREKDAVSNKTSEMDLDEYEQEGEVVKKGACYGKTVAHVNTTADMEAGKETQKEVNLDISSERKEKERYKNENGILKKISEKDMKENNGIRNTCVNEDHVGSVKVIVKLVREKTTTNRVKNLFKITRTIIKHRIVHESIAMINHYSAEIIFKDYIDANICLETLEKNKEDSITVNIDQKSLISKGVIVD